MATDAEMPCERALHPVLDRGYAICPGCLHVVKVKMVDGLWTFAAHDNKGRPTEGRY